MRGSLKRATIAALVVAAVAGCTSATTPDGMAASSTPVPSGPPSTATGPDPSPTDAPASAELPTTGLPSTSARLVRWVDGDTLVTSAGRVRLLGMDTPERGQCGFGPATSYAGRLAPPGSTVELVSVPGDDDRDRYDRLLRYVYAGRTDVGYAQILAGYAIARYDSRDGYGPHPHEHAYVAADVGTPNPVCPA